MIDRVLLEEVARHRSHLQGRLAPGKKPVQSVSHSVNAILWVGDAIRRAGTLDIAKLIQTWEGANFSAVWGEVEMRACDHQMLSPGYISEILEPDQIPAGIRYYGNDFPYIGRSTRIPKGELIVTPKGAENSRCA